MEYTYFPGCTLYNYSKVFNESAQEVAKVLGINMVEPDLWQCCGAVFPLVTNNVMPMVSPFRTLLRAKQKGSQGLITLCSACYNVLKRTNHLVKHDVDKRRQLESFLAEGEYGGEIPVLHLLEIIRDKIGYAALEEKIKVTLDGLRIAPYYGCLLLRPAEVALDNPDNPRILEDLFTSLGAEVLQYPYRMVCCSAYISVVAEEIANQVAKRVIESAVEHGANCIATSCPLCFYNLNHVQEKIVESDTLYRKVTVIYFTQLLAVALGLKDYAHIFDSINTPINKSF